MSRVPQQSLGALLAFPKLDGCGGFDISRCIPNTKDIQVVSITVAQSPIMLEMEEFSSGPFRNA